jgi:Tfp pilus assembly PilM family ATPase
VFGRDRLTVSLESDEVRVLVVRGLRILRWGSAALPAGVVRNGQVADPAAFGRELAGLLAQVKGPKHRAIVGLNGQRAIVRIFKLPEVPARLLGEAVQREARRELPLPLDELYLSWQPLGNHSMPRRQVFALGVPRDGLDNAMLGLRSAGVRPVAMDLNALALVRAANLPDVLLADVHAGSASVVLVRGFVPYLVRSVASPGGASRPLPEQGDYLVSEIQRTLDFYESTQAAAHPAWSPAVCLTGALGAEETVRARVQARWPLVEPVPPLAIPGDLPLLPYLANVGLALKRLRGGGGA